MFKDRTEAGEALADKLRHLAPLEPLVLALPRGGVPVAVAVARRLGAPLDLLLVRKIGAPFQPELALGAIVDGAEPTIVLHDELIKELGIGDEELKALIEGARGEIERRRAAYFDNRQPPALAGRTVIVVDDGVATGATVEVALKALQRRGAARRVLAVPVAPDDTLARLAAMADEIVCLEQPSPFHAVGVHYRDFHQLSDADVIALMRPLLDRQAD